MRHSRSRMHSFVGLIVWVLVLHGGCSTCPATGFFFVWFFFFSFFVLLTVSVFWIPQVWKASIWPQMVQIGGTISTGLDFFCCACCLFFCLMFLFGRWIMLLLSMNGMGLLVLTHLLWQLIWFVDGFDEKQPQHPPTK